MVNDYILNLCRMDGKNAIVTGGSRGIGRAVALALGKLGASVTVTGRDEAMLRETAELVKAAGGECSYAIVDASSHDDIEAFFKNYCETHKTLDVFVNNAGYTVHSELADTKYEDICRLVDTNLVGAILCLQKAANIMKAQKGGSIVLITSVNALNSHPGQGMYSVTKFGLEGAMKALASTMAEYGVRVNSVAPGAIDTDMNAAAFASPETLKAVNAKIPMGRVGAPDEIANVVAFVASDMASYMTGSTIVVDGGMMLKHK